MRLWRFGHADDDQQGPRFGAEEVQCLEVPFATPHPKDSGISADYCHPPGHKWHYGAEMLGCALAPISLTMTLWGLYYPKWIA